MPAGGLSLDCPPAWLSRRLTGPRSSPAPDQVGGPTGLVRYADAV